MLIFGKGSSSAAGLVKCPFCAELIQGEAIKCKHCGSDIQPHAKSQEPDPTLWAADNYFKLNNGDVVLEQGAIDALSISLIGLHPGQLHKDVYEQYKAQIRALSNELPPQIRDTFRQTIKSKF
ncbi:MULTISPECIES: zinc ribbon domain-containing protein [Enterobacter cloacae complex]|uniref:zinc ribbon domain-containing protein n=1 Tax=Enterobacter cloacae complex TaxID=354276 RepID=UPI002880A54A|nr:MULTISPECIES: zinc ribbon domain-containing protein [Enterobacter cloacae complex]